MSVDVNINKLSRHITLNVRIVGIRRFRARVWLGIQIIRLAVLVSGLGLVIENPNDVQAQ